MHSGRIQILFLPHDIPNIKNSQKLKVTRTNEIIKWARIYVYIVIHIMYIYIYRLSHVPAEHLLLASV